MDHKQLARIYSSIAKDLDRTFIVPTLKRGLYRVCTKAALVKLVEMNQFLNKVRSVQAPFFYSACLRSSCEDLIALKYLKTHPAHERDSIVFLFLQIQAVQSVEAQTKFFQSHRCKQLILTERPSESRKLLRALGNAMAEINIRVSNRNQQSLPKVIEMARTSDLETIYNFVYRGTSKVVHFNPHHLLRLGWNSDIRDRCFSISTRNFSNYYKRFSAFYASFLFVEFVDVFYSYLNLKKPIRGLAREIKCMLDKEPRWPELVTYEEMNIDPQKYPNFVFMIMDRIMAYEEIRQDRKEASHMEQN
jgi:Family of unknown function (DUF5677)